MFDGNLIDSLTYASYKAQRQNSPYVSPERWGKLFAGYEDMEARYQAELLEANSCIASIGTDATGENGFTCGKPVSGENNLCAKHEEAL